MFFLNFGLFQLLAAGVAGSALIAALYLLDRSRRRQVVSTLRFWTEARQPVQTTRKRHIQQPWSLVLQLLGTLLLLLAIAQPRFGNPFARSRDHVLVLDTSAWMGARRGNGTLMEAARRRALQWLAAVPANDRVMVVRADGVALPVTGFEADHRRVTEAIAASEPGATALDLTEALATARAAQGEIVFVGAGRVKDQPENAEGALRVLLIPDAIPNVGIRAVSAQRSTSDLDAWQALVTLRNFGRQPVTVTLAAGFDHAPMGFRRMELQPNIDHEETFTWRARAAGLFEARLSPEDGFADDDWAALQLPASPALPVVVYTTRPDALRPLLAANPRVVAQFRSPAEYRADGAALSVFDRFAPTRAPEGNSIYLDPPAQGSPIPISHTVAKPQGLQWNSGTALSVGLHQHDLKLEAASILQPRPGDIRVADVDAGPVIVARPGNLKTVVIGFDPERPATRYELATPLMFANILRWMNTDVFRQSDVSLQPAGNVTIPLEQGMSIDHVTVTRAADGAPVPFTADRNAIRFFAGTRDDVRVTTTDRETTYSFALPDVGAMHWTPPANALRGIPRAAGPLPPVSEIWPALATAGALCFLAEWLLFARMRRSRVRAMPARSELRRAS